MDYSVFVCNPRHLILRDYINKYITCDLLFHNIVYKLIYDHLKDVMLH